MNLLCSGETDVRLKGLAGYWPTQVVRIEIIPDSSCKKSFPKYKILTDVASSLCYIFISRRLGSQSCYHLGLSLFFVILSICGNFVCKNANIIQNIFKHGRLGFFLNNGRSNFSYLINTVPNFMSCPTWMLSLLSRIQMIFVLSVYISRKIYINVLL